MSRIAMAVIALIALSLISVDLIQKNVIDRAKKSNDIAEVEPQKSANPRNERNAVYTTSREGPAADVDAGFVE